MNDDNNFNKAFEEAMLEMLQFSAAKVNFPHWESVMKHFQQYPTLKKYKRSEE